MKPTEQLEPRVTLTIASLRNVLFLATERITELNNLLEVEHKALEIACDYLEKDNVNISMPANKKYTRESYIRYLANTMLHEDDFIPSAGG